ncbi:39S ribosomal protein L21, mitochondrial [Habropoda laboriosa]|uniref:Large ribosomal subunit protein bL21m n=1 Tax=Habropoda laboriosa TaxID=597456 RepID=A0A0L7QQQ3_9HYME|nr:PREDICTED: 39S ribosomal protein L21, mitochondrial [Habropoda laboriosa]KOC60960.1 39S ribosomal protein L21, mitochondrial [Habropoda laboriosa]
MATLTGFTRLFNFATNTCIRRILPATTYKQYYPALKLWEVEVAAYRTRYKLPWFKEPPSYQEEVPEVDEEKEKAAADVLSEVNKQIATNSTGRLFAIIYLCGTQFKVTESDIITVEGQWPPQPGDKLTLEKVLLVGSTDFTLIGRPLLNRELVSVDATVVQKTLSHTITRFRMKRRKQYRRLTFYRVHRTMLRINAININGDVDKKKEVEGLDRIY